MSEQEVQWGEWTEGHDRPIRSRPHEDGGVVVQSVSAAYLNALEREVRELRVYKVLADEMAGELRRVIFEFKTGSSWSNEKWLARYDALPGTSEGEQKK